LAPKPTRGIFRSRKHYVRRIHELIHESHGRDHCHEETEKRTCGFPKVSPEYPKIVLGEYDRADHEEHEYEESLALTRRGIGKAP
jgi:hypothetical protein